MSNHEKKSTNKEGAKIGEMHMKIDMGMFITLPSVQVCVHTN
jgi:hypothetical protein